MIECNRPEKTKELWVIIISTSKKKLFKEASAQTHAKKSFIKCYASINNQFWKIVCKEKIS